MLALNRDLSMPTPPDPAERRYSEQELSLILKRATERQAASPAGGEGLSLAQIQEIAAEVGLSPAEVAVAAAQVRSEGSGGATRATYRLTLPAQLSEGDTAELFEVARERTQARGSVAREANGATWTATDGFGVTRVAVTSRNGRSTLAVSENRTGSAIGALAGGVVAGILIAPVAGLLFASAVGAGLLAVVVSVVAGIAGGMATAALLVRRMARRWRDRTNALGAELARVAMGRVTRGGAEPPRLPGGEGP